MTGSESEGETLLADGAKEVTEEEDLVQSDTKRPHVDGDGDRPPRRGSHISGAAGCAPVAVDLVLLRRHDV